MATMTQLIFFIELISAKVLGMSMWNKDWIIAKPGRPFLFGENSSADNSLK